jgi:hypothetical protein
MTPDGEAVSRLRGMAVYLESDRDDAAWPAQLDKPGSATRLATARDIHAVLNALDAMIFASLAKLGNDPVAPADEDAEFLRRLHVAEKRARDLEQDCDSYRKTFAVIDEQANAEARKEPVAYLRDLDGTGSLHVCAKGDPGATAVFAERLASKGADDGLREALKPFANIAEQIRKTGTDNRWLEQVLFYAGSDDDPTKWSLTGQAFDNARAALSPPQATGSDTE